MMDLFRFLGNIEKENIYKDDKEIVYDRDCVDFFWGIEIGEKNGRSDNGSSSEEDIVYGVDIVVIFSFICVID